MFTLMYRFTDDQILTYASRAVLELLPGPVSSTHAERLLALLQHGDTQVLLAVLSVVQKLIESGEIINFSCYASLRPLLLTLLGSNEPDVRLEATRTFSLIAGSPRYELVIDLDVLRAVSNIMTKDAGVRALAVNIITNCTKNTPTSIMQLFNHHVVRTLCGLLPLWKLNAGNIPTFQHGLVRDILDAVENILGWGAKAQVNPYAAWFDDYCLDMLLTLIIMMKHEGGSVTMFRREFVARIKNLLQNIESGLDESEKSDKIRSMIRNMVHWHFKFEEETGPTIPVMAYLAGGDSKPMQVPRSITLPQLHKTMEEMFGQWVVLSYLDDSGARVQIDDQDSWNKALAKFDRDGVKTLRLFLAVSNNPLYSALPSLASSNTAHPDKVAQQKQEMIGELQSLSKFSLHELDKWVTHWMSQSDDGNTDKTKFRKFMGDLGLTDPTLADKIFSAFDVDGSGSINIREFITGLSVLTKGTPEEKIDLAFRAYDADRSGYIDKNELRQLMIAGLSAQGYAVDGEVLDAMVDECMEIIDQSGDGRISLEEFKDAWRNPLLSRQMSYLWNSDLTALMGGTGQQ